MKKEEVLQKTVLRLLRLSGRVPKTVLPLLADQLAALQSEGWPQKAIFQGYVWPILSGRMPVRSRKAAHDYFAAAHALGNAAFWSLFVAVVGTPKQRLRFLYHLLGVRVDGHRFLHVDKLQKNYDFSTDLVEAMRFDVQFSKLVRQAYPKGIPILTKEHGLDYKMALVTHQFRYYLDWKNNRALRRSYPDCTTDLERLQVHCLKHPQATFRGERARYHNKYLKADPPPQAFTNSKLVSAKGGFHTEFILDKGGNLISQWEVYEPGRVLTDPATAYSREEEWQIVNGNSVNYSKGNGLRHQLLDVKPVGVYDSLLRQKIGKKWKIPSSYPQAVDYFDNRSSLKQANQLLNRIKLDDT